MFWRVPDGASHAGSDDWPRTNAELRGELVAMGKLVGDAESEFWLHAKEVKQPGGSWTTVSSDNCWMPLDLSSQNFVLVEVNNKQAKL